MKLGVFDSGIGGEAVAAALRKAFPNAAIHTINDKKNVPYGDKPNDQIFHLTNAAIQPFLDNTYDCIILACNTATAVAITRLRALYPNQKFIGIEPMIKTAASLTTSKKIAVCATPATLSSERYLQLVKKYGKHLSIMEPDCSNWAYLIENDLLNREMIEETIVPLCSQGVDVIVLGCTHYHWIKDHISAIAGTSAAVIEPSDAIARRVLYLINESESPHRPR